MNTERVRAPAVAGLFYPGEAGELKTMVRELLDRASVPSSPDVDPVALVSPHAGFIYSGQTAACAYKGLKAASKEAPRRVFLLGPSHRVALDGLSVGDAAAWETPLGRVEVDKEGVDCLAARPDVSRDPAPHRQEHALETQLPFLQETLVHFRIVPMVYGEISGGHMADLLAGCWRPGDLIVVSTDLSHYHGYEEARVLDALSNRAVLARDPKAMSGCEACGSDGVQALLETARRRGWQPRLADLRNSGDTAGDRRRVVGYASYLFYPEASGIGAEAPVSGMGVSLPALARVHLSRMLAGGGGLDPAALAAGQEALAKAGACFVTLTAGGQLRGCIGSLEAHRPLAHDLLENAASAALRDPRFPPLTARELQGVEIEVSILTPPEPLPYRDGADLLRRLKPGVHGVILNKGGRRATFLPQVWSQLPDPEAFLEQLCRKAGLEGGCWRQGAEIRVYTVEKFLERQGD